MSPATIAFAGVIVVAAIYCGMNPFNHGAMAGFPGFETYKVELAPATAVPSVEDSENRLTAAEVRFMDQVQGRRALPLIRAAEGRTPALQMEGLWFGMARSGRILRLLRQTALSYVENEHICGRPLGLRFDKKTGDLYIADAYFGLLKVGPQGGLATSLTTETEGDPFKFTNDLDIDEEGNIYFTVSSNTYYRRNFLQSIFTGDPTGRLLKYNPVTKETTVLLHGLQFPNGVSLSKDGSFLVLTRYWLKGEKAGTPELFAIVPGAPDNLRTNENGEFWVAIHCRRRVFTYFFAMYPKIRKIFLKLPIPTKLQYLIHTGGKLHALIMKYGADGNLLKVLEDRQGKVVRAVSEVEEKDGKLWIGSVLMPYIAVYADGD
ncbi:hypothetical protein M5K25_018027 [Dendrobium thyrsiflorum]|uniref:Strictosidine synthase conserved region domain-containing protein n=1 Tax=Dendrobium thyrsiflorum TaxID=117978 RepID=A0ABD0UHY5_DENTH